MGLPSNVGFGRVVGRLIRAVLDGDDADETPDGVPIQSATAGALAGIVSGSGPTCAFLAANEDSAVRLAGVLSGLGLCRQVRRASGPVPGARQVA